MTNELSDRGLSDNYRLAGRISEDREQQVRALGELSKKGKVTDPEAYEILSVSEVEALLDYAVHKGFHTLYETLMPYVTGSIYPGEHKGYARYRSLRNQFPLMTPDIFDGLEIYPLRYTKINNFRRMATLFDEECHDQRTRNQMAYRAFLLFETPEKFQKFVKQTAKSRWQAPMVTCINQVRFPQKQFWQDVDFRAWGNVFLRFGLKATNGLFVNASPYTTPARQEKSISLRETWMRLFEVREYSGIQRDQAAQLVDEVEKWNADPKTLTKILDILRNRAREEPDPNMRVPDFAIDGESFGMPGTTFRRMDISDMRIFFIGKYTDCCEWVGGNHVGYNETPEDVFHTRMSDYFIIEDDDTGEIISHTWAWRTNDGGLVFDGFESFNHYGIDADTVVEVINQSINRLLEPDMDGYEVTDVYLGKCSFRINESVQTLLAHKPLVDAKPLLDGKRIGSNALSPTPSLRKVGYIGFAWNPDPATDSFDYWR